MIHVTLEVTLERAMVWQGEPSDLLRQLTTWTRVHRPGEVYHVVSEYPLTHEQCRTWVSAYLSGKNRYRMDLNASPLKWELA